MAGPLDLSYMKDRAARRRVAAITLGFAIAAALYALLAPPWYISGLTVVPAKPQKQGLSGLLNGDLGSLAAGLDIGGANADVPRIAAVLQSTIVSDAVIEKFDLRARYGKKYMEAARDALWDHCAVKMLAKPGLVQLSCEDKDPRFAQQMVGFFADYGNQVFRRVSAGSATEEVRFLEKRVAELKQQAEQSATRMREFQEKHGIVDIESQSKAVVSAMAGINAQKISKQMELDFARSFSSGDEDTTRQLQSELSVMERKLRDLERSSAAPPPGGDAAAPGKHGRGVFPAAFDVPKLRAEFEGLYRDRKVAEVTLVVALERLEGARANEARDVSTFQVLDPPTLATRKSRPRGSLVVTSMTLLGLALALGWEWWKSGKGRAALVAVLGPPAA
jgi:capsule polysaccharide export protein KpsE/RkpR